MDIQPPHDVAAEEALLASALIDPTVVRRWQDAIRPATGAGEDFSPGDFYVVKNGWLWGALVGLVRRGQDPDQIAVAQAMGDRYQECGGDSWLAMMLAEVPSALHADTYAQIVLELSTRRRVLRACSGIAKLAYDTHTPVENMLGRASGLLAGAGQVGLRGEPRRAGTVLNEILARIEAIQAGDQAGMGLPTGYRDLDKLTWGMFRGDLIYVAARPRVGKSALLGCIADNVARRLRQRVLAFSLEMPAEAWLSRSLAAVADVDYQHVRLGTVTERDLGMVMTAAGEMGATQFWIDDTAGQSDGDLRTKARRLHDEVGLSLILVDYVQMVRSSVRQASRYLEVGAVSRSLKDMARELAVPVMAACMVGRAVEQQADKMPGLADLRESGNLEADADQVWFLHRPEIYNPAEAPGIAQVKVDKNRNGPTGMCALQFDKVRQRFADLAVRRDR